MAVIKSNMRLWVADLRTTDAPQIKEVLRGGESGDGYCCLGRACEVAIENGVDLQWDEDRGAYLDQHTSGLWSDLLPRAVSSWLGLEADNPIIAIADRGLDGDEQVPAAEANDELGWSFAEIADAIEAYYELNE